MMARSLNLKECRDHTRPPLGSAGATFFNILGVLCRNDILARLGMIHDGLSVWEEAIEEPVEDTGGHK